MPDDVRVRVVAEHVDLEMVAADAAARGCPAGELFAITSGEHSVRAWLDLRTAARGSISWLIAARVHEQPSDIFRPMERLVWTPSEVVDVDGPRAMLRAYLEQRDVRTLISTRHRAPGARRL